MTFLQRLTGRYQPRSPKPNELSFEGLAIIELPPRPVPTSPQTSRGQEYWRSFNEAEARYGFGEYIAALNELNELGMSGALHKGGYLLYLRCLRKVRKILFDEDKLSEAAELSNRILEHPELQSTASDDKAYQKILSQLGRSGPEVVQVRSQPKATGQVLTFKVESEFGWAVEEIAPKIRPDKGVSPWKHRVVTNAGTVEISPRGLPPRPEELSVQRARVRYHDLKGVERKFDLDHVAYRIGTHPYSDIFATLSEQSLELTIHELSGQSITSIPIASELSQGIEGKYQVRCVAASRQGSLFTVMNRAFLSDPVNRIWQIKTPPPPGVKRRVERRRHEGLSQKIEQAAELIGVEPSADLQEVRRAYRSLAMRIHPDRNPDAPGAHQKMVGLNAAYELLTEESARLAWGTDEEVEVYYSSINRTSVYLGEFGRMEIEIGIGMTVSGGDWIYAAALAEDSQYAYLGCSSGRVFIVDLEGHAVGVLNVQQPVRALVPLRQTLFIQTDTRVFGVEGSSMVAEIDIWEKGATTYYPGGLMVQSGRSLHVFDSKGLLTGRIEGGEPLRGFWRVGSDLQIETNKSVAVVRNVFDNCPAAMP